jgi:hypothetical protein
MPKGDSGGRMGGFQLWANLPAAQKMMEPRYRDVTAAQIPVVALKKGVQVRVVCGEVAGVKGPVQDIVIDPQYLDVLVPACSEFTHDIQRGHTAFAYIFEGNGRFDGRPNQIVASEHLILFLDGDRVEVSTGEKPVRFLLISGKPIGEPVAWRGPIVMNTQAELNAAFEEYHNGTFIKHQ